MSLSGRDSAASRRYSLSRLSTRGKQAVEIGSETWLRVWYRVICRLPSSYGCDVDLVVLPKPIVDRAGRTFHGQLISKPDGSMLISCALEQYPLEAIGTLLHEVAHFAQNPRHSRHHGYSFRRCYVDLIQDFIGIDVRPQVAEIRKIYRKASRAECIDVALVETLGKLWPMPVYDVGDFYIARERKWHSVRKDRV